MKKIWIGWIIGFLITAVAAAVIGICFRIPGLIRLELAPNAGQLQKYILEIASTDERSYHILQMNTLADYFFILGYSMLTFFSFAILLDAFDAPVAGWVYVLSLLTGFFDVMENNFLLNIALRRQEEFSSLYYYIVRIKWGCAIIPILVIPLVIVYGIVLLSSNKQENPRP